MTDLDQDAETARNGHVGYTHAQADAEGKDWLRDHPPYCAGCAALDRILARMDETVIEHQRARITELEESTTFYKGAYITADKERNALVIERSNIANELKAYPDSDLVSLAKTYETARVASEARIAELEEYEATFHKTLGEKGRRIAELERLLKQERTWLFETTRKKEQLRRENEDLDRDYRHEHARITELEAGLRRIAQGDVPLTKLPESPLAGRQMSRDLRVFARSLLGEDRWA